MRVLKIGIFALASLAVSGAAALESTWLFDGSLSGLAGRDPEKLDDVSTQTGGAQAAFYVMPILGWRGSNFYLSPSFDFSYSGVDTPLEVDDDLFLFSQQTSSMLDIGGTYKPNEDSRWSAKGFYENFSGKVTKDEEWGKGLYDYQDLGGFLNWNRKWNTGLPLATTLGYRYTDRQYFNFTSLDGSGLREKDSLIHKIYADLDIAWPTDEWVFNTTLSIASSGMAFKELRIQDESGLLVKEDGSPTDLRKDQVTTVKLTAPLRACRHHWYLSLESESRDSNISLFDSQSFTYIANFNDYVEGSLTIGYGYEIPAWWVFKAPYIGLQLTGLNRMYSSRPAQDATGNFIDQKQSDNQSQFNVDLNSAISEHWGIFFNSNSSRYRSNNSNEGSSLYEYQFITTSLGLQFSY